MLEYWRETQLMLVLSHKIVTSNKIWKVDRRDAEYHLCKPHVEVAAITVPRSCARAAVKYKAAKCNTLLILAAQLSSQR